MDTTFEQRNTRSLRTYLSNKSSQKFDWNEKGTAIRLHDGGEIIYVTKAAKEKLAQNNIDDLSISEFRESGSNGQWIPLIHVSGSKKGQRFEFPNHGKFEMYSLLRDNLFQSEYVLLFDLDGTLLDSDIANDRAYKYALWKTTGTSEYSCLDRLKRITRKDCNLIDGMTADRLNTIIHFKQWNFMYQVREGYTAPLITMELLKQDYLHNPCYIITSADPNRAKNLIEYYDLTKYVNGIIYTTSTDKYQDIAEKIGCDTSKIILFENEETAIKNAIDHGIMKENIYFIRDNTLREHTIQKNGYLSRTVRAFYSMYYVGYNKPNNPNFINDIKNQFGTIPTEQLELSKYKLCRELYEGILNIYNLLKLDELVVVAIPRAKAESYYTSNQQLFRQGIAEVVSAIKEKTELNIIDGSHYIRRHTNTKTTHLAKSSVENDGEMPYCGITKSTCSISDEVVGKDILLIDDIYTKGVNIDEDAIQALYDKGAKSVTFFSICKTVHI